MEALSISIAAVSAAVAAVAVAVWEGIENRHHNRLSSRPRLQISQYSSLAHPYIGIGIKSQGLGPAIIESFTVLIDDSPLTVDWLTRNQSAPPALLHTYSPDDTLPAGENEYILSLPRDRQMDETLIEMFNLMKRIKIEITYKSLYDERFELKYVAADHLKAYKTEETPDTT